MFIKLHVTAGAKNERVVREGPARYRVSVREAPRGGEANKRLCALFAARFGVPPRAVRIVSGHHAPSKMLSVDDRALAREAAKAAEKRRGGECRNH